MSRQAGDGVSRRRKDRRDKGIEGGIDVCNDMLTGAKEGNLGEAVVLEQSVAELHMLGDENDGNGDFENETPGVSVLQQAVFGLLGVATRGMGMVWLGLNVNVKGCGDTIWGSWRKGGVYEELGARPCERELLCSSRIYPTKKGIKSRMEE